MNAKADKNKATAVDPAYYQAVTEAIRAQAVKLLKEETVVAVIGYYPGRRPGTATPALATTPEQAEKLIFSPACVNNLSLYLTKAKKGILKKGKVAIVAKGCDLRALAGLMGESQIAREDLVIIGVACAGVYGSGADRTKPLSDENLARKCRECTVHSRHFLAIVAAVKVPVRSLPDPKTPAQAIPMV